MSQTKSVERKRGTRIGFWFFFSSARVFGLGGAYGLLYLVCLYYLIVDRPVVGASLAYVKRRFPEHTRLQQIFDIYRLFVSQGKSLIDRHAVASGYGDIHIQMRGFDRLQGLLREGNKGFILLTAHVGNWQVAMTALRRFNKTVHLMMRPEDNVAVKKALNIDAEDEGVKIISTDGSLGGVVEAMRAINQGELVSIMGDRTYDFSSWEASFLGDKVRFPYGAFSIAAAVQCPVIVLLSAKTGRKNYIVDVSQIIPAPVSERGKKDEAIQDAVQEFARVLESYVQSYPYQWFVFRDIWKSNV